jgi:hypothetical protein
MPTIRLRIQGHRPVAWLRKTTCCRTKRDRPLSHFSVGLPGVRWGVRSGLFVVMVLAACQSPAGGDDPPTDGGGGTRTLVFAPSTTKVIVEVDYETGSEPYTGTAPMFGEIWAPTVTNIERLFSGTRDLTIPTTLSEMADVGAIDDNEITIADVAALADLHRNRYDSSDTKTYWVLFANGYFADTSGPQRSVLGISIGDTIVMFKDVIASTGQIGNPNTVRFVEQSTLVHELAHAIGLVDNGIPMVVDHKDEEHGAHCTNPDCVEYWLNEGVSDARDFALRRILTDSTILFDDACLADVDALTR